MLHVICFVLHYLMPRHNYKKKQVDSDIIYDSFEISKFINYVMLDGKKSTAQRIIYSVLKEIKKTEKNPLEILRTAINNVAPNFEVKPRRLGGASYLVPTEVRRERRVYLALNWIINAATARSNKEFRTYSQKLLAEILDAAKNQGAAVAKKQQTEKLADANKAFTHLKW